MRTQLTPSDVRRQLAGVTEKLAVAPPGQKRMALLRRQAQLGDLRDAIADRQRRERVAHQ
jgi:hypothetical protein